MLVYEGGTTVPGDAQQQFKACFSGGRHSINPGHAATEKEALAQQSMVRFVASSGQLPSARVWSLLQASTSFRQTHRRQALKVSMMGAGRQLAREGLARMVPQVATLSMEFSPQEFLIRLEASSHVCMQHSSLRQG